MELRRTARSCAQWRCLQPWPAATTGSASSRRTPKPREPGNRSPPCCSTPCCLNCHLPDSPLQGDDGHPHIPQVVGGPDNLGVAAIGWASCHNQTGNDPASEKHVREDKLVRWGWQPGPGRETTTNEGVSGPEADAVVGAASSRPQRRRHLRYTMPFRL